MARVIRMCVKFEFGFSYCTQNDFYVQASSKACFMREREIIFESDQFAIVKLNCFCWLNDFKSSIIL